MNHIKRDFIYYAFLENIDISAYKALSLDSRVQSALLANSSIVFSLSELYYIFDFEEGLMKEFTYVVTHQVWIFSGNKEVLKRLKKPSN